MSNDQEAIERINAAFENFRFRLSRVASDIIPNATLSPRSKAKIQAEINRIERVIKGFTSGNPTPMTDKDTNEKKNKNPELKNRQIRKDSTGKAKDNYRED